MTCMIQLYIYVCVCTAFLNGLIKHTVFGYSCAIENCSFLYIDYFLETTVISICTVVVYAHAHSYIYICIYICVYSVLSGSTVDVPE